jgi:hypothetical protein
MPHCQTKGGRADANFTKMLGLWKLQKRAIVRSRLKQGQRSPYNGALALWVTRKAQWSPHQEGGRHHAGHAHSLQPWLECPRRYHHSSNAAIFK